MLKKLIVITLIMFANMAVAQDADDDVIYTDNNNKVL